VSLRPSRCAKGGLLMPADAALRIDAEGQDILYSRIMEIESAARIFAALGQERRLSVLRLLIARGPNGLSAGELAGQVGMPASTSSFHLSALERAGVIVAARQKQQIIYALRVSTLRELLAFLTEACCGGHPEMCGDIAQLLPLSPEESSSMTPAFNVLFLCTRNSARSIMAEAILNRFAGERFRAYSAGSGPAQAPMPEVLDKLRAASHGTCLPVPQHRRSISSSAFATHSTVGLALNLATRR
jgi:DNA-binding transcriptional ArsR family regulator